MPEPTAPETVNLAAESLWPLETELVGLRFALVPEAACDLYPQYTIGFHAWFLGQIQQFDPALSAQLHDGETDKAFNIPCQVIEFMFLNVWNFSDNQESSACL